MNSSRLLRSYTTSIALSYLRRIRRSFFQVSFDQALSFQPVEDKNDFICLPNNEENLFRSIEFDPMILRLHRRKAIVLKTTAEKGKKFNFLKRKELKNSIEKTIKRVFGFDPIIENFSQPTWAAEGF